MTCIMLTGDSDGSMCLVCCHCPIIMKSNVKSEHRILLYFDFFLETCRHEKTDVINGLISGLECVNVTKLSLLLLLFMSCIEP